MPVNKNLIILWLVCLILIITAILYRLSGGYKETKVDIDIEESTNTNLPIETSQVFYEVEKSDAKPETKIPVQQSPISAKAYLVGNVENGEVYLLRNRSMVLPVASMSKLITAVESIDQFSITGTTTTASSTLIFPDSIQYSEGEIFTIEEALYPLLVSSSNVMAEALATTSSRSHFMDLMSSYAWEIGMPATYFADPSGISPQNMSSANDFFALAKYLYKLRPDILAITRTPKYTLATTTEHGYHEIVSTHPFVNEPNFIGGKTGRTPQAKDTMLTILNIDDQPIAFIVLGSLDRKKDTLYLIRETKKLLSK